ncbi:MAG: efflux RND transporter periplasmic adaptor subunit [Candidatus Zixiibacteriota bacterium]|nr:MAG: efflux RND transporter periplasmic adaptor subunit [candidate division Zixibacteria bacterium]
MKKKKVILIALGVIVVGAIVVLNITSGSNGGRDVNAAAVEKHDLKEIVSASGRIQPATKVDITSEVNGEIIALLVEEGQLVEPGDLLVVLDTVQLRSDVDQARFFENETRARLTGARTTLDQNEEEYQRQERLFEQNLTSETEYKNAKYAYLNAKSAYDAAEASAAQAKSRYEKQLDNLSKAKIISPMAGVITYLDAEVGEIAAAQTAFTQAKTLMTISDLSVFEVEVEVDETEINKVELAQDTEIEVDAFPDTTFAGEVVEIGNTAITQGVGTQDQTTNFRVKVVFKDTDVKIRPGMSATVDITTAFRDQVLAVPFSSVVMRSFDLDSLEAARAAEAEESTGVLATNVQAAEASEEESTEDSVRKEIEREELKGVFVIREGVARFVEVKTGIADQKNIEVIEGLEEGDTVISGPYRMLRTVKDGDQVKAELDEEQGNS